MCFDHKITFESALISLKASATCLAVAPPPTSKKFAGSAPWSLIISIVAIARPAPFTATRTMLIKTG